MRLLVAACLAFGCCAVPAYAAPPFISIPRVEQGDKLDGATNSGVWQPAAATTGFSVLGSPTLARMQPRVFLCYDAKALYVAVSAPRSGGGPPIGTHRGHDEPIWEDDAFEVFVSLPGADGAYYQFIVGAGGGYWESRGRDPAWNGTWSRRVGFPDAGIYAWEAAMAIPWKTLGLPGAPPQGTRLGLNVAWDCRRGGPFVATWAPMANGDLHQSAQFGQMALAGPGTPPRLAVMLPVPAFSEATPHSIELASDVKTGVRLQARAPWRSADAAGSGWFDVTAQPALLPFPRKGAFAAPGTYGIDVQAVAADGTLLLTQSASWTVPKPLSVTVRQQALRGEVLVDVDASPILGDGPRPTIAASLTAKDGKSVTAPVPPLSAAGKATVRFDVSRAVPGQYSLLVQASKGGAPVASAQEALTVPSRPWWLGSKEGLTDKVYPPFVPLKARGSTVLPWGRSYRFAAGPLPTGVASAKADLLARPIALRATVEGEEQRWRAAPARMGQATGAKALLQGSARSQKLALTGKVAVEFDGMIRAHLEISGRPGAKVDDLTLEVPISAAHARYLYHYPGAWGSSYNAGALPKLPWVQPFRPFVWLGDEDRGFCWFSESDRNIYVKDEKRVCEIVQDGDAVVLRVHLLEGHILSEPLSYTFGFEATPIRPNAKDVWDFKIAHSGAYGMEKPTGKQLSTLSYPLAGHLNAEQGTIEMWVRPGFDPDPPVKPDDPGRGAYNQDLLLISSPAGEFGYYWNIDDRGMRTYVKRGGEVAFVLGSRSPWRKDEWHHIAFTWGDRARLYCDGKEVAAIDGRGFPLAGAREGTIRLGGGEFDVEAIRISRIARQAWDLARPLAKDADTLLLELPGRAPGEAAVVDGRFQKAARFYAAGKPRSPLDTQADLGVKTICFHEHWTDIQNYTSTTHDSELRSLVAACHARGIQLLLYHGYEMSNIAPEFAQYAEECLVAPRAGGYTRQPPQTAYIVCYRSIWQDFMAAGIAKLMDEYGIDGVYLDGTANPWGCSNELHGCGYRRPDGSLRPTYPLFEARDMMRRIFNVVKSRKPDGQVNVHQSTCMTIPSVGFATSYWDGEQFGAIERGPRFDQVLPLAAFRCEFMGRQWGVPAEFLCYDKPYTTSEAYAFTLQHDVLVRGGLEPIETHLWRAMDLFGRKTAEWLPYWRAGRPVTVTGEGILAGLYLHRGKDAMLIVSNLGSQAADTTVDINLADVGLADRRLTGTDVLTDEKVPLEGGKLTLHLPSMGWRMLWVR